MITAFAPATVSNVNCGFDVLGFAMEGPGDEVQLALNDLQEVRITKILPETVKLSTDPMKNTAGVAIRSYLKAIDSSQGVDVVLTKNLPLGSGMGSSGASAAAALIGINKLMGNKLSNEELVPHAMEAERIACGSAHADNVAPSIMGGFVLVRSYHPLDIVKIPSKANLWCALVHPQIELRTEDSRKVLPEKVEIKKAISQTGNIAGLMIGLMKPDLPLLSRSLVDEIAEPHRIQFIPGYLEIKKQAKAAGATGSGISGSGPSIFALGETREVAEQAGERIQSVFKVNNVTSEVYVSPISDVGARILN
ncbi:MAG: homoserine kinase [Cyclobacteriaceae bacterium]|nr:homoserine kinase [Cyclobacteriaceae bacterium]